MSIVEERLETAITALRGELPLMEDEVLAGRILHRRDRARSLRLRVAVGSCVALIVVVGAAVTLAPSPAMASFSEVVLLTEQSPYEHIVDVWQETAGEKERERHRVEWRQPDGWVVSTSLHVVRHSWQPGVKPEDTPLYQDTVWTYNDGRRVTWNPSCKKAVLTTGPVWQPSQPSLSLDDVQRMGKVVQSRRAVHAHGGVFDSYWVEVNLGEMGTMHFEYYVDPSSHRVRFMDMPMQHHKDPQSQVDSEGRIVGTVFGKRPNDRLWATEEFRFPGSEAPQPPSAIASSVEKSKFLREISTPVAAVVVGGIKKTLFGVVVRGDGQVLAVTQGGAPENIFDSHEVKIVGTPSRRWQDVPPVVGGVELAGQEPVVLPQQIGGSKYLIESTRLAITGPVPSRLTLKIPAWNFDKSHPLVTASGKTYRSAFAGYATFTTTKIFTMPQGLDPFYRGPLLPSGY